MVRMRVGAPKRPQMVVAFVALLVGAALVAYPYVSDYLHKLHQVGVIQSHESAIESQTKESLQRELEASYAYNERLLVNRVVVTDPFDPSNRPVTQEEYEQRCNVSRDGVMGSIVIPAIDVTVPIYHGTGEEALANGAGHLEATSLPVGGPSSHCVVAGHNGLPSVRIFDDLHKLKVGDYFVVQVLGEDHAYRITSTETVLPTETDSLVVEESCDLMTLVTCTPYGLNTHRLLVHAERCEVPASWYERDRDEAGSVTPDAGGMIVPFSLAGAAVALGIVSASVWRRKRSAPLGPTSGPYAVHARHGASAQEEHHINKRSSGGSSPFRVMPRVGDDVHQEPRHARRRR